MIKSRIKSPIFCGCLLLASLPVLAQTPAAQTTSGAETQTIQASANPAPSNDRDASFMPLSNDAASAPTAPTHIAPVPAPGNGMPAVSLPATAPSASAAESAKSTSISQPVESKKLQGIDPDSIGLMTVENGGLGADMWKGTSKELVMRVLPMLMLPTDSATLNELAQRLLLTTANVPEGASDSTRTLTSLRIEKLVALGDAADAWKLARQKPEQVDEGALQIAAEAALVSSEGKNICAKMPDFIRTHTGIEWQKMLVVCQLRGGDNNAAQLALEVMRSQDVKDDTFLDLAERNVISGSKSLPRQLTPLKPLNLALLRLIDEPLPPEIFAHPETAGIPELLLAKARDDSMRLTLAERSAAHGIIGASQLAAAYKATLFPTDKVNNPLSGSEDGPHLRALLYQAASAEKSPQKRLEEIDKFLLSFDAFPLNSTTARLLTEIINDIPATSDYSPSAPDAAYVYIMAGKPKEALAWLKVARQAIAAAPQIQNFWPLVVLAGLETDSDYSTNLHNWFNAVIKDADHDRRERIGDILLLFEAAGYSVPEDIWAQVLDASAAERRTVLPPVAVLERLHTASTANRRGETVLLTLAAAYSGATASYSGNNEPSLLPAIESVRALRVIGLTADALMLARETASSLLMPARSGAKY